ncbi:hypothetical protein Pcinc_024570 [Petrolisthes cinctipes]|uniref:Uncharacterized protein n=1 Tax=Petrolisthes cinctipes TaxID=88211 RepID=A0AAE1FCD1_PETCI|nr:hypothetical protein Pcinc_024570 [Petrolisthes cinctipes]
MTGDDGVQYLQYRAKPLSHLPVSPSKVSLTATLDTIASFLDSRFLNPGEASTTDRVDGLLGLCLSAEDFVCWDPIDKPLDLPGMLSQVQEQPKAVSSRRLVPPSFPIRLGSGLAPPGLRKCFWRPTGEKRVMPNQVMEPDAKLLAAVMAARQDLFHLLSLKATSSLLKKLAETRLSAARELPEVSRRGVARAAPTSASLFDQAATEQVLASQPPVVHVSAPVTAPARMRPIDLHQPRRPRPAIRYITAPTAPQPQTTQPTRQCEAGGADAFGADWNRWNFIYIFPLQ